MAKRFSDIDTSDFPAQHVNDSAIGQVEAAPEMERLPPFAAFPLSAPVLTPVVTRAPGAALSSDGVSGDDTGYAPSGGGIMSAGGSGTSTLLTGTLNTGTGHYQYSGNRDIDGVLIGSKWTSTNLTFSFPTSGSLYGAGYNPSGNDDVENLFVVTNAAQQTAARMAFSMLSAYTALVLTEITETETAHANIRMSQTTSLTVPSAYGEVPTGSPYSGDIWFGMQGQPFYLTPARGNWGFVTILHEIGHTMGLKHGHDEYSIQYITDRLPADHDGWGWSLMTYRSDPANSDLTFQGDGFNQPQTYMQDDIAALQYMYGANFATNAGDSVYTVSATTGELFINGVGQGAPSSNKTFLTIWDGGGVDTYDFSNFTGDEVIDLTPGGWSTDNAAALANTRPLTSALTILAPGNIANALLYQGDLRSLIENATAGSGNDVLTGNIGVNALSGGAGNDVLRNAPYATLFPVRYDAAAIIDTGLPLHDSRSSALSVARSSFDLLYDYFTASSEETSHANIKGTGDGHVRFYSFTTDTAGGLAQFDIDSTSVGFDSYLTVYDAAGNVVAFNNDSSTDDGGGGSTRTADSFVQVNLGAAGTYYVAVSGADGGGTGIIPVGATYTLNISLPANRPYDYDSHDTLTGGTGDDTYYVSPGDSVIEDLNQGIDTVVSSGSYSLGANVENLALTGLGTFNGTGNGLDNVITGNAKNNILTGGDGNDSLRNGYQFVGNRVHDDGGLSLHNTLQKAYQIDFAGFEIRDDPNITESTTMKHATILGVSDGNLRYYRFIGDDTGDRLVIDVDDTSPGLNLFVTVYDDAGNNRAENDNATSLDPGSTSLLDPYLTYNLPLTNAGYIVRISLPDGSPIPAGMKYTLNISMDYYVGPFWFFNQSPSNDRMIGGTGNDTYYAGINDTLVEAANEGTDTAVIDVAWVTNNYTYTLAANIENLAFSGTPSSRVNAIGNSLNNVMTGNDAINIFTGLAGDDTYIIAGNDTVVEAANEGNDTVVIATAYTLGANVENLVLTGTDNINGTGNALGNVLTGNAGSNVLTGLGGDDTYVIDASDTVVEAVNGGRDTVVVGYSYTLSGQIENLTLSGSANINGVGSSVDNVITGNQGNNQLDGSDGNDVLAGGLGADTLTGGSGDDTYIADGSDSIVESAGAGNDEIRTEASFYALGDDIETLKFLGGSAFGVGNALDNILTGGAGDDSLSGGLGSDTLIGLGGNDLYFIDSSLDVIVEAADGGEDLVSTTISYTLGANLERLSTSVAGAIDLTGNALGNYISGGGGSNTINGATGNDYLLGNGGNDVVMGGEGNDFLDGGDGSDTLYGGAGDDTYSTAGNDVIVEAANEGVDLVFATFGYTLGDNIENLYLIGAKTGVGNSLNNVITGDNSDSFLLGLTGDDTLNGLGGDDTLYGGSGNDSLLGGAGNDTLYGEAGDDTLVSGAGQDIQYGGEGNDLFYVGDGTVVIEAAGEGYDTVFTSVSYTLADNVENLFAVGLGPTNLTGNALNNFILGDDYVNMIDAGAGDDEVVALGGDDSVQGGLGNDSLDGGAGADTLAGGAGNDTYIVDTTGDVVTEIGGQGTDVIFASVSYTMGASIEVLNLTGVANIDGTGNSNNNILNGNDGNNSLNGGSGLDTMSGGAGDDTYYVNDAGDRVVEGDGGGTDTVFAGLSYSGAGQYIENITLTGSGDFILLGNGVNNILRGNAGNNDLNGSGGADTMIGGAGSDTYTVDNAGDVVTETGTAGVDVVNSRVTFDIGTQYIEIVNLTFNGAVNAYGSTTGRAETLNGNTAANLLDGRSGADTMAGGLGNDTYVVDNAGDLVMENAAEGTDLVTSYLTYTLTANVENLTLLGAGNLTGTGNTGDNSLTGTTGNNKLLGLDGNDYLDGFGGNDTLTGGIGNDTYVVDGTSDSIVELAGQGTDTVMASYSYALGVTLDNLTLTGSGNINATGNGVANILTGNGGSNVLDGGVGADTMIGGVGDDSYYVDDAGDIATEANNQGMDTVFASVSYVLGATSYIDILTLTGSSAINGTGNGAVNTLNGNSGANLLDGAAGNDILTGGAGNDTLIGGNGADAFVFGLGSGQDVINDFKSGQNDTLNLHAYSNGVAFGGGITLTAQGSNTLINLGGGNTILVMNIIPTDNNFLSHIVW